MDQQKLKNRLIITLPLLGLGALLTQLDFNVLWRYFSWSNQTLAMAALWLATVYLLRTREHKIASLITAVPATFMTAVSLTYIMMAKEGFGIDQDIAYPVGIIFALLHFIGYMLLEHKLQKESLDITEHKV